MMEPVPAPQLPDPRFTPLTTREKLGPPGVSVCGGVCRGGVVTSITFSICRAQCANVQGQAGAVHGAGKEVGGM